jgi:hypothetical protein
MKAVRRKLKIASSFQQIYSVNASSGVIVQLDVHRVGGISVAFVATVTTIPLSIARGEHVASPKQQISPLKRIAISHVAISPRLNQNRISGVADGVSC